MIPIYSLVHKSGLEETIRLISNGDINYLWPFITRGFNRHLSQMLGEKTFRASVFLNERGITTLLKPSLFPRLPLMLKISDCT
jgi:hypothetical protein